jgi:proteic killer suppression protein
MIRTWRNAASRKLWEGGRPNRFSGLDMERAMVLLDMLDAASSLEPIARLRDCGARRFTVSRGSGAANGRSR